MIDSFITYDSNPAALASPSYFSKHIDDIFKYNVDADALGFLADQGLAPHEVPKDVNFEQFSHGSAYSTTPSTKNSPEHTPNLEDQGSNDDEYQSSKVPPITRKGIKKHYEPIFDGNKIYRYEDSPSEYRKARKRIQNRESAARVRNRKKTQVEVLDEEIQKLVKEKSELQAHNTALIAENNMLKQQVNFLEKMMARNEPSDTGMIDIPDSLPDGSRTETDSILHFINKSDEELESQAGGCKYFRSTPSHQFKKHVALLGVFTILLCVYGLVPRSENNTVQLFSYTKALFSKPNSLAFAVKNDNDVPVGGTQNLLENQKNGDQGGGLVILLIELLAVICYVGYFIYVSVGMYKHLFSKRKNSVYNSLP